MQPSSESTTPKRKWHWLQFNLRTLLVLTLVVGLLLGWVMNERRKNARIRADIVALKNLHCHLVLIGDKNPRSTWIDQVIGRKIQCCLVTASEFIPKTITDADLVHLKGLTELETLVLKDTAITDTGLKHLTGLTQLRFLDLSGTSITDDGLRHLMNLRCLRLLHLDRTAITDAEIAKLKAAIPNCTIITVDMHRKITSE